MQPGAIVSFYARVLRQSELIETSNLNVIRELTIIDDSNTDELVCTIWAKDAKDFVFRQDQIVLFVDFKIKFYNCKTVTSTFNSRLITNPQSTRALQMKINLDAANKSF